MLQHESDRLAETRQALFTRLALTVGSGHFRAIRDVPRAVSLDDRRELVVHGSIYRTLQTGTSVAAAVDYCLAPCPKSPSRYSIVMELIFEIHDAEEGGFYARALGHAIFTEGETWEELRANVLEAVSLHFEDAPSRPRLVQMHYVKDELIPLEAA